MIDDWSGVDWVFLLIIRGHVRVVAVGDVLRQINKSFKLEREIAETTTCICIVYVFSRSQSCLASSRHYLDFMLSVIGFLSPSTAF